MMIKLSQFSGVRAVTAASALLCAGAAQAVTVDAGDYTRLPDGTNLALLYYQRFEGQALYARGAKVSGDARLTADVGILRVVRFVDVGSVTIVPQFLLPFGRLGTAGALAGASSTNGTGDLIFAPTVHLLQDPERKRSFAITPWIYIPIGNYDHNNALNAFGENRWKLDLQAGYVTPLGEHWTLDLIADALWYGRNKDFGPLRATLKQAMSYQLQSHLRYHLGPSTHVAGMLSYEWGGETMVAGIGQADRQRRAKALLTVGHFVTPTVQLLASYGQDQSVRSGVKERTRFNLRLLKVF